MQFTNDTVANNTVTTSTGGAFNAPAGGLVLTSTVPIGLKNTIVATTPSTANCDTAGHTGAIGSAGGNIDSGVSCGFSQPWDQYGTNPMVNPVANNSGPVETASLQAGSPAIGRGVTAGAPSTDARGVPRPKGQIDVGAFQASNRGYWMVGSDGGIFTFGTAGFHGSEGGVTLNAPVVGMAVTPTGGGYWEVAADGGVFTFGNATYYGSMGSKHLNAPVVGMAAAPTGKGYWLVASDGGIFAFGSALFHGSKGGQHLNAPVVGIAADPTGNGYWEVASDGGIFNYGSAGFFGSKGGQHLNAPVVGVSRRPHRQRLLGGGLRRRGLQLRPGRRLLRLQGRPAPERPHGRHRRHPHRPGLLGVRLRRRGLHLRHGHLLGLDGGHDPQRPGGRWGRPHEGLGTAAPANARRRTGGGRWRGRRGRP